MRLTETEYLKFVRTGELMRALTTIAEQGFKYEAALFAFALGLPAPAAEISTTSTDATPF